MRNLVISTKSILRGALAMSLLLMPAAVAAQPAFTAEDAAQLQAAAEAMGVSGEDLGPGWSAPQRQSQVQPSVRAVIYQVQFDRGEPDPASTSGVWSVRNSIVLAREPIGPSDFTRLADSFAQAQSSGGRLTVSPIDGPAIGERSVWQRISPPAELQAAAQERGSLIPDSYAVVFQVGNGLGTVATTGQPGRSSQEDSLRLAQLVAGRMNAAPAA
jgi:hypothetical protein